MSSMLELKVTLCGCIFDGSKDAFLVDDAHTLGTDLQRNPHILFVDVEFFGLQVGGEGTFGVDA